MNDISHSNFKANSLFKFLESSTLTKLAFYDSYFLLPAHLTIGRRRLFIFLLLSHWFIYLKISFGSLHSCLWLKYFPWLKCNFQQKVCFEYLKENDMKYLYKKFIMYINSTLKRSQGSFHCFRLTIIRLRVFPTCLKHV